MLYSRMFDIAFAHYPKTAGHSLTQWFCNAFPDAEFVEQNRRHAVSHLPVRQSLVQLGLVPPAVNNPRTGLRRLARACANLPRRLTRWITTAAYGHTPRCNTRIIGVVREPFEMLVSLFEYWRRFDFEGTTNQPLIECARTGTFREFLAIAVVDRMADNYYDFFDMGGPASANTRLLDFHSLEPALLHICREFGVNPPAAKLGCLNASPTATRHGRDLLKYRTEAGSLVHEVHAHFHWYYKQGVRQMITGSDRESAAGCEAAAQTPGFWNHGWHERPSLPLAG